MLRRHWPLVLALTSIVLLGSHLVYTERLTRAVRTEAALLTEMFAIVQRGLLAPPGSDEAAAALLEVSGRFTRLGLPIVVVNAEGVPYASANLPFEPAADPAERDAQLLRFAARLRAQNAPVEMAGMGTVYYGDSPDLASLRWVPWLQAGGVVVLLVIVVAILRAGFRAERERMWASMARELAHQMGTPLSSLAGWVEVLRLPTDEQAALVPLARVAEEIAADVERLERVSRRFELIGKPPAVVRVEVADLINDVAGYFRPRLPRLGTGVGLRVRVQPGLPPLRANRVLLAWALENLVTNALDALAGRGGRICILAVRARTSEAVHILVADTGPGIPPAVRRRIFEPGFTTKPHGWGVGLSLARRIIVGLHGGRITMRPRRSGGTIFDVRLPAGMERGRRRWVFRG